MSGTQVFKMYHTILYPQDIFSTNHLHVRFVFRTTLLINSGKWYNPIIFIFMPSPSSVEEKPNKRAPRKRAVRKTAAKKLPQKSALGKKAVEAKAAEAVGTSTSERGGRPVRKAPTPIAANRADSQAKRNQFLIVGAIFIVGIGASAAISFFDEGSIDVNQAIEERNERLRSGQLKDGDTGRIIVPVQNTAANQLPDGGLVGLGIGTKPPAPPPATTTATSTASTTDATASSTEEILEEDAEVDTSEQTEDPEEEVDIVPTQDASGEPVSE